MIKIEIIESNIVDAIGIYNYQFDTIYIGRSKKADIILFDNEIPLKFLTIKIIKGLLTITNEPNSPFYFVNGKKMSGMRKLKPNDKIQFGKHSILIVDFSQTKKNEDNTDLQTHYENLQKNAPELKFLLSFLEEEIISLEEKQANKNV